MEQLSFRRLFYLLCNRAPLIGMLFLCLASYASKCLFDTSTAWLYRLDKGLKDFFVALIRLWPHSCQGSGN